MADMNSSADVGMLAELINANGRSGDLGAIASMLSHRGDGDKDYTTLLLILLLLGGGGNFRNGNCYAGNDMTQLLGRLDALAAQVGANQANSNIMGEVKSAECGINGISSALGINSAQLQSAITALGGAIGINGERGINAGLLNAKDLISAIKDCCCQTQQNIIKSGYEAQINNLQQTNAMQAGFSGVQTTLAKGFADIGYAQQAQTSAILQGQEAQTQKILDKMCVNETQALRDKLGEYRDAAQSQYIINQLKPATT